MNARLAAQVGGRRNGRAFWSRCNAERQAAAGEHTHVLGPDGTWCLTRQPVGFLWALVTRPQRGGQR